MFAQSFAAAIQSYDALAVARRVTEFVAWKRGGPAPLTTADKPSGYLPDGGVFAEYVSLGMHHFHMDLVGTEPLLAYIVEGEDLTLVALTSHRRMFHGNERQWLRAHRASWGARQRKLVT